MSEINMHKYFLNTLWEFTRGVEEDKDSFIEKALKVCKTFKIKSLKFPREQLEKMTGEDRKNYHSIVLRRWRNRETY